MSILRFSAIHRNHPTMSRKSDFDCLPLRGSNADLQSSRHFPDGLQIVFIMIGDDSKRAPAYISGSPELRNIATFRSVAGALG